MFDVVSFFRNIPKILKPFIKPFLFIFFVYLISLLALFRANTDFIDDIARLNNGGSIIDFGTGYNRFVATLLGFFIYGGDRIYDISPFSQIIAVLFIAIASVIFVYVLCDKKIRYIPLFCTLPFGLSPFFIECFSYKIDAPFMALAVLLAVLPWVFVGRRRNFIIASCLSLLAVLMLYHVALGMYIIIALFMFLKAIIGKGEVRKSVIDNLLIPALCLLSSAVIFYIISLIFPPDSSGVGVSFAYFIENIGFVFMYLITNSPKHWLILMSIIFVSFVVLLTIKAKGNRVLACLSAILIPVIAIAISPNLSLLTMTPATFYLRYMFPVGAVFAAISAIIAHIIVSGSYKDLKSYAKYILLAPVCYFAFCFMVFASSYGNALNDTNQIIAKRNTYLHEKIINLFPDWDVSRPIHIYMTPDVSYVGRALSTENSASKYSPIYHLTNLPQVTNNLIFATFLYNDSTIDPSTLCFEVDDTINKDDLSLVDEDTYYAYYVDDDKIYIEIK